MVRWMREAYGTYETYGTYKTYGTGHSRSKSEDPVRVAELLLQWLVTR